MKLNEIVLEENQALVPNIIEGIQKIAIELNQKNGAVTRRELVIKLNGLIPKLDLADGRIVNVLVKEAYHQTPSPVIQKAISKCFIDNFSEMVVYDPYKISDANLSLTLTDDLFDLNRYDQKSEILNSAVELSGKTDSVSEITETKLAIDKYVPKDNFSLTGKTKVKDTFNYAKRIHNGYFRLINQYEFAKNANLDLIVDFEVLRNELLHFRQEIAQLVSEVTGEDIRNSHPDLFDFYEIEYFDIEKFRGEVNLAFDSLGQKLQIFNTDYNDEMLRLKDAGVGHVDQALNRLEKTKKRRGRVSSGEFKGQVATAAIGFAFDAFLSISETRKNAEETVAQLKHDIEAMKLGLKEDTQLIAEDLLRLAKIHSRIKRVLIPGVKRFIQEAKIIFNSDIRGAYSKMVEGSTIDELSSNNRRLAAEKKQIDLEKDDRKLGIEFCENEISRYKELISEIQFEYDYVNNIKPDSPNTLHNIISFGIAKSNYEEHLADWNRITEPIRSKYTAYVTSMTQEEGILCKLKDILEKLRARLHEIEKEQEDNKVKIRKQQIKIENFEPQFQTFKKGIKQITEASNNFLKAGIAEDLLNISVPSHNNSNDFAISEFKSIPALKNTNMEYLNEQKYKMELKLELLNYSEAIFMGELDEKIGELTNENVEKFIVEQKFKMKSHLTTKIHQKTKLNIEQANQLVNLGSEVFISILKTQKIKAETSFMKEINNRIDQEFLERYETSVTSLRRSIEKDQQEAKAMGSALKEAKTAEDLLNASDILQNN